MPETKEKISLWSVIVVVLSLLLFFFAVPHTLEDFAVGEPAEKGVPAQALAIVVASLFALQGLALFWAGQQDRRNYFIRAGLGILWPLAAGAAQLPLILASSNYRSGLASVFFVVGIIATGILLFLASVQALRTSNFLSQEKKQTM